VAGGIERCSARKDSGLCCRPAVSRKTFVAVTASRNGCYDAGSERELAHPVAVAIDVGEKKVAVGIKCEPECRGHRATQRRRSIITEPILTSAGDSAYDFGLRVNPADTPARVSYENVPGIIDGQSSRSIERGICSEAAIPGSSILTVPGNCRD